MPTGFYYGWWNISMEKNKLKLSRFQIMSVWPKNRRCLQVQNLTIYSTLHASPNDSLKIVHTLMAFLNIYSIISQKREYHGTGFSAPHVWCLLQPGTPPITLFRYWHGIKHHGITNWWHRVVLKNIDFQAIQLWAVIPATVTGERGHSVLASLIYDEDWEREICGGRKLPFFSPVP